MPKIKLQKLNSYKFEYETTIQHEDINSAQHLGNDKLISIINKARVSLFNKLDSSESDLGDGQTGIILADLGVNYINEGFLFDKIKVLSHIGEISRHSFRIFHQVLKDHKIIALIETGIVAFNYSTKNVAEIPAVFLERLNNFNMI